jgi:sigma-54 dependent transcriptional regulator, acetoin dehydrogenase operon transcriptional activator AcoR
MYLAEIRDTASKFAATIAKILDVDVMIIDRSYVRIANTFSYINDPPPVHAESITGKVLASGKTIVVSDKISYEGCRNCKDQDDCCISQIIAVPVFYEDQIVGAIDLLVPFGKQSRVFENLELSIDFLERMADLLSSKLRNIDDYNKLDIIKKEREILLDFMEEALVYTNESGEMVHWNHQFAKVFDISQDNVGKRLDKVLDHPQVKNAVLGQRSLSNQAFSFSGRNVEFNGFLTSRIVQRNGSRCGIIFLFKSIDRAFSALNELSQRATPVGFDIFKTNDPSMQAMLDNAKRLAVSNENILVIGAPGTGKSMLIRAIHDFSDRASMPFLVINCRGFSPDYLEEEIFGKNMEEDEVLAPDSKLRMAHLGTVFFRHIEELPRVLQHRLTRILKAKHLDSRNVYKARMIFSSSRCLVSLAKQGMFDEELAIRISHASLTIPSLSDRRGDVSLLVDTALAKAMYKGHHPALKPGMVEVLKDQPWPGNVRQIEQAVDYLYHNPELANADPADAARQLSSFIGNSSQSVPSVVEMEKNLIRKAVAMYHTKDEAAEALQIGRATLYRKLKQYGLS